MTCAMVFKRMWKTSVRLWGVLTHFVSAGTRSPHHPLHLPSSSAQWPPFGRCNNRAPTPRSSLRIQGNPGTSVTLRLVNWQRPICSTDKSQPPGSLARSFLTGSRGPVTRKLSPAYTRSKWHHFPACTVAFTVPFTSPSELLVVQSISQETLQKLPPPSVIYVPC